MRAQVCARGRRVGAEVQSVLEYRRSKLTRRNTGMPSADGSRDGAPRHAHVGAELRAARERLGWSLQDVSANLRIRYAHLVAVEEGRLDVLPGAAYAIGFVRSYAKLLGLDSDEMSRRLRAEIG